MTASPRLAGLLAETLRAPQDAARRLIALGLPIEARWTALALVTILAIVETRLAAMVLPELAEAAPFAFFGGTWTGIALQFLSLVFVSGAITVVGGLFGGTGRFADAILIVAWLEFILILAQVVQVAALLVIPPLGAVFGLAAIGLFIWLLVQFTAALHGFADLVKVFIGIAVSFVVIVTALALILTMFGLTPPLPKG